jgi:hypothetical protein
MFEALVVLTAANVVNKFVSADHLARLNFSLFAVFL